MRDDRRKRLFFQSWHRGCREADLILGTFAERHLDGFTEEQLGHYEALLELDDGLVLDWIMGRQEPPQARRSDVLDLLLTFDSGARPA